jgi:hypothetical protein
MRTIGGSDLKSTIYGILKHVLTNSLAGVFSWAGFKGKKSFKDLRLARVITSKYPITRKQNKLSIFRIVI